MPLVSQSVEHILNGVSQRPQAQRLPSQVHSQTNVLDSIADGKIKRPPLKHVAQLTNAPAGFSSARVHAINRDSARKYRVAFLDGDLKIFNTDGTPVTLQTPDGKAYLATTDPARDIRVVTIGDTSIVVNTGKVPTKGTEKAPAGPGGALVWVRQADYSTSYSISLDGLAVNYRTTDGAITASRGEIATDVIATRLAALITGDSRFAAFTVNRYGSTLHIFRADGVDFDITTTDGLADVALLTIKGEIQRFEDLPARAADKYVVKITGDPDTEWDDYWVVYDDEGQPEQSGVWRECAAPGSLLNFDPTTMPHQLVFGGDLVGDRRCGDTPEGPTARDSGTTTTPHGFTFAQHGTATGTIAETNDYDDYHNGEFVLSDVIPEFSGAAVTIAICFDVHHSLAQCAFVRVTLSVETGAGTGTYTELAHQDFPRGTVVPDQVIAVSNVAAPTGARVKATFEFSDGVEHSELWQRSWVTFHSKDRAIPGIAVSASTAVRVSYTPDYTFPEGSTITLTVDGTPFVQNGAGQTWEDIAALFVAAIDADAAYTATTDSAGVFDIVKVAGGVPVVSASVTLDRTTTAYIPDAGLVADTYAGATVENITDGSSGTIVSNGIETITVAALTGGSSNTFSPGDLIRVSGGSAGAVFRAVDWNDRACGNDDSVPFPSFVGRAISDVFVYRGRLGFTSGENVVLSRSGDLFNFFRQTASRLLDDDVIDVANATPQAGVFRSSFEWNEQLYLNTDRGQYKLSGDPLLTPQTASLALVTQYPNDGSVHPAVAGNKVFFARKVGNAARLYQYFIDPDTRKEVALDITQHVPSLIAGTPLDIAADDSAGMVAVTVQENP